MLYKRIKNNLQERYIIFGNYGNETIALIQWMHSQKIKDVFVVSVETGWGNLAWNERILKSDSFIKSIGYQSIRLKSRSDFSELVQYKQNFPNQKFQWCAHFLKGLPFLDYLDEIDSACEATIVLGHHPYLLRRTILEFIDESPHYGGRKVWNPFFEHGLEEIKDFIKETPLNFLEHRSLECSPCIHSRAKDIIALSVQDIKKTVLLEKLIHKNMFESRDYGVGKGIEELITWIEKNTYLIENENLDSFSGCNSPFACGI